MRTDVDSFLSQVGLTVVNENGDELVLYCPFHHNTDTPSFSINKKTGLWQCFNPSCGKKGRFAALSKMLSGRPQELRDSISYEELILDFDEPVRGGMDISNIEIDYDNSDDVEKIRYLLNREFELDVLRHFEIGFSQKRNRVVIPVRDLSYNVVGFIGRAVSPDAIARYIYSSGFPRKHVLFNLQNARAFSKVIITEGSLDAIKIHQAGYHNVIATLGSKLSEQQAILLNKYFDDIVIFSDNDDAGRELAHAIMAMCPRKGIEIVQYPEGVKDPGDMTKEQITECINKAIDDITYTYNLQTI